MSIESSQEKLNPSSNKLHKDPIPTVDVIIRRGVEAEILLETRGVPPFEGCYALPGGHVDYGETVEETALREVREELSLRIKLDSILGVYSDPNRDPRGQRITTVFVADCIGDSSARAADDAASAEWLGLGEALGLGRQIAFDHRQIIEDYGNRIKPGMSAATFWSSKQRRL